MERLNIPETNTTPTVTFNPGEGYLSILGRSVSEDAKLFYDTLEDEVDDYCDTPQPHTRVIIGLDYINTPSVQEITHMLTKLVKLQQAGKTELEVNWHYEAADESLLTEIGMIEQVIDFKINKAPYDSED